MQQLAKECLEIHEKIKQLSPIRQGKGDKLAAHIKSQLLSDLGEDYCDIDTWCNSGDSYLDICINIPVTDGVNDHVIIYYSNDDKKLVVHSNSKCRFSEIIAFAQSIVDKLNGKE